MRILLVEDDDRIAVPILEDLRCQKHSVDYARDGREGWNCAQAIDYDLILLDVMLPKLDGIGLCRQLRSAGCKACILMMTARDTTADKVLGLDAGADDYLVKPFDLEELSARIRALARRSAEFKSLVLEHGALRLEPGRQMVTYGGQPLLLTPKEFMIVEQLLRQPNQVFTRANLLQKLWELEELAGEGTIKTHVTNLRRKLKLAGCPENFVETVYGVGYRLCSLESL
jgi:two-component system, OmpR family, response regulator QseB